MLYYVKITKNGYVMIDTYRAHSVNEATHLAMRARGVSREQVQVMKYRDIYGNVIKVEDKH